MIARFKNRAHADVDAFFGTRKAQDLLRREARIRRGDGLTQGRRPECLRVSEVQRRETIAIDRRGEIKEAR